MLFGHHNKWFNCEFTGKKEGKNGRGYSFPVHNSLSICTYYVRDKHKRRNPKSALHFGIPHVILGYFQEQNLDNFISDQIAFKTF